MAALSCAPAIVRAESLMRINTRTFSDWYIVMQAVKSGTMHLLPPRVYDIEQTIKLDWGGAVHIEIPSGVTLKCPPRGPIFLLEGPEIFDVYMKNFATTDGNTFTHYEE
jgi:hypothetical protein